VEASVFSSARIFAWNFGASPHMRPWLCFVNGLNVVP
jgi:hypothetical protein